MHKILKMLPYLLACELIFLILPLIGADTGGLMILLFIVIPIVCFIVSSIYGVINKFCPIQLLFPLFTGVLFTITFYIVNQEIVWIYTAAYTAASLVGNAIGYLLSKFIRKT